MNFPTWDSYFYPNTNILINNLGITDQGLLNQEEARLTAVRIAELGLNPIQGNFNLHQLQDIHGHIFKMFTHGQDKFVRYLCKEKRPYL